MFKFPIYQAHDFFIKTAGNKNSILLYNFVTTQMLPICIHLRKTSFKVEDICSSYPEVSLEEKQYWEELGHRINIYITWKFTYLSLAESWLAPSLDLANSRVFATWVFEAVFCPDEPGGGPFTRTIFNFGFFSLLWNYKINFTSCCHEHKTYPFTNKKLHILTYNFYLLNLSIRQLTTLEEWNMNTEPE